MKKRNKRILLWSIISVVIIAVVLVLIFTLSVEKLTHEELLGIVKPLLSEQCSILRDSANHSTCPTCKGSTYNFFEKDCFYDENCTTFYPREHSYTAFYEDGVYNVVLRMSVIYGWNTRNGVFGAIFKVDREGNIISENIEKMTCM